MRVNAITAPPRPSFTSSKACLDLENAAGTADHIRSCGTAGTITAGDRARQQKAALVEGAAFPRSSAFHHSPGKGSYRARAANGRPASPGLRPCSWARFGVLRHSALLPWWNRTVLIGLEIVRDCRQNGEALWYTAVVTKFGRGLFGILVFRRFSRIC